MVETVAAGRVPRIPVPASVLRYYVWRNNLPRMGATKQNDPALLIMVSLADEPRHGYALTQDIATFAGVTLGPGTLYGAITRLEERGLIAAVASDDPRRRPYRLTGAGRASLDASLAELRTVVDTGAERLASHRHRAPRGPLTVRGTA